MPSRGVVAAILLFWLGSTSLLIHHAILPRWRTGSAPPFRIELTDEIGAPQVAWDVLLKDRVVGRGISQVRRRPDLTFDMYQRFKFDDLDFPVFISKLIVRKLESTYRVTRDGELLGIQLVGKASLPNAQAALSVDLEAEMTAEVRDGILEPKFKVLGVPVDFPGLRPINVTEHGSILNPMHLVHRLPGLREGQRWKVPLLDPLKMFSMAQPWAGPAFPYLEAEVTTDLLDWHGQETPCFHILYREPGKDLVAATWVRQEDAVVLAQQARHHGYDFTIRRSPAVP